MSRADNCYDNAFTESCFGAPTTELEMTPYPNDRIPRKELPEYIRYCYTGTSTESIDNTHRPARKIAGSWLCAARRGTEKRHRYCGQKYRCLSSVAVFPITENHVPLLSD